MTDEILYDHLQTTVEALIEVLILEGTKRKQLEESLTNCQAENTRLVLENRELKNRIFYHRKYY